MITCFRSLGVAYGDSHVIVNMFVTGSTAACSHCNKQRVVVDPNRVNLEIDAKRIKKFRRAGWPIVLGDSDQIFVTEKVLKYFCELGLKSVEGFPVKISESLSGSLVEDQKYFCIGSTNKVPIRLPESNFIYCSRCKGYRKDYVNALPSYEVSYRILPEDATAFGFIGENYYTRSLFVPTDLLEKVGKYTSGLVLGEHTLWVEGYEGDDKEPILIKETNEAVLPQSDLASSSAVKMERVNSQKIEFSYSKEYYLMWEAEVEFNGTPFADSTVGVEVSLGESDDDYRELRDDETALVENIVSWLPDLMPGILAELGRYREDYRDLDYVKEVLSDPKICLFDEDQEEPASKWTFLVQHSAVGVLLEFEEKEFLEIWSAS